MAIRFLPSRFVVLACVSMAALLAGCGENPYAPPPLKRTVSPPAATQAQAAIPSADVISDLKECAGVAQALVGFDPIAERDRDEPEWLPMYFNLLGRMEKEGIDFAQRVEAASSHAALWQIRSRADQEARGQECRAKYPG